MRITKSMVESIVEKEATKKFYESKAKVEKDLNEEVEREVVKSLVEKVPQDLIDRGYIKTCSSVKVSFGDKREYFEMGNSYPSKVFDYRFEINTTKKISTLRDKRDKLLDEETKFRSGLKRVLTSFSSHQALVANLPELKEYFADVESAKTMALIPVEQIKEVRSQLVKR